MKYAALALLFFTGCGGPPDWNGTFKGSLTTCTECTFQTIHDTRSDIVATLVQDANSVNVRLDVDFPAQWYADIHGAEADVPKQNLGVVITEGHYYEERSELTGTLTMNGDDLNMDLTVFTTYLGSANGSCEAIKKGSFDRVDD